MKVKVNSVLCLSVPLYAGNFPEIPSEVSILLVKSASTQESHDFGDFLIYKARILSIE